MAIFHLSVKMISRGKGKSAVAAAAYRSSEKITSDYDGITHDYTRKRGVVMTEILLPKNAPVLFYNRSRLWNAVEKIEKAKNAQLAREVEVSIPKELDFEEGYHLVKEFCQRNFVDKGMIADICFHDKGDGNPHAHIMLTVRPFNEDRSWGSKQKKEYILDENGEKIYDKKKHQYKCKSVPTTDWNDRYSMYEMEECIENEERYGEMISRLEKMGDKIERNKTIAYLEYDIEKDKVEPEDAEKVSEERNKIRPEIEQQAKAELTDMYGREFDSYLFSDAVEETDELLEGKVAARAEEIEVDKDIDEIRR